MATATVNVEIDPLKLWRATFGGGPFSFSWWQRAHFIEPADWETPGSIEVSIENPNSDNPPVIRKTLTSDDLVRAYKWLLNNPRYHCFGYLVGANLADEDFDACEGDTLLQIAMLGEEVYG